MEWDWHTFWASLVASTKCAHPMHRETVLASIARGTLSLGPLCTAPYAGLVTKCHKIALSVEVIALFPVSLIMQLVIASPTLCPFLHLSLNIPNL